MSPFLPPDHSAGDANTIGGYQAVHARPAAFEGKDGSSYSVEIVVDETGDPAQPYAGYLLFIRWKAGDPVAAGHLETAYLVFGHDEASVYRGIGAMRLNDVKQTLDRLIDQTNNQANNQGTPSATTERPWYEVMHDDDPDDDAE